MVHLSRDPVKPAKFRAPSCYFEVHWCSVTTQNVKIFTFLHFTTFCVGDPYAKCKQFTFCVDYLRSMQNVLHFALRGDITI